MSQNDILGSLRDRGVIEMDGEGRPIEGLLRASRGPGLLVLNCLVREPYLRTESTVLAERGAEVLEGFEIMAFTKARDERDHARYLSIYNIDNDAFFGADLIINTERYEPPEIVEIAVAALEQKNS